MNRRSPRCATFLISMINAIAGPRILSSDALQTQEMEPTVFARNAQAVVVLLNDKGNTLARQVMLSSCSVQASEGNLDYRSVYDATVHLNTSSTSRGSERNVQVSCCR